MLLASKNRISVIIPCRNEEKFIARCLDSVIGQNYPSDKIEVLAVDGMSADATASILQNYSSKYSFIKRLENPKKIMPAAFNIGLKASSGEIIVCVNAHSVLDKYFLKYSVEYLQKTKADAVGGRLENINEGGSPISYAIAFAVNSVFGSGGKRYRAKEGEGFVNDTLPYCVYPKETFKKFGVFNEELIRAQDSEFNYRILKRGGKIFFSSGIKSYLYVRPSLHKMRRQYFQHGYFDVLVTQNAGIRFMWRYILAAVFAASIIFFGFFSFLYKPAMLVFAFILFAYLAVSVIFSLSITMSKGIKYLIFLPVVFFVLHFSFGAGYLKGLLDFVVLKKRGMKDMPLSR